MHPSGIRTMVTEGADGEKAEVNRVFTFVTALSLRG